MKHKFLKLKKIVAILLICIFNFTKELVPCLRQWLISIVKEDSLNSNNDDSSRHEGGNDHDEDAT